MCRFSLAVERRQSGCSAEPMAQLTFRDKPLVHAGFSCNMHHTDRHRSNEASSMRFSYWSLAVAGLIAIVASTASAQVQGYGCRGSGYSCGELSRLCSLGSQTPYSVRPYCGGRSSRHRDYDDYGGRSPRYRDYDDDGGRIGTGCRGSGYSCSQLRYYCSLGRQTPYSVRPFC